MKYDDASWHFRGEYPDDLPNENSATHIGMFLTWCLLNNLASKKHIEDNTEGFESLKSKKMTPCQYLIEVCDEKFIDSDLNELGNEFTKFYYESEGYEYYTDYSKSLDPKDDFETLYHIPDRWQNYGKLKSYIDKRYRNWIKKS